MSKIKCKLECSQRGGHVQQLLTGFVQLHNRGIVDLTESTVQDNLIDHDKTQHLRDSTHAHLLVTTNDTTRIYYDCHDSWEINEQHLNVDYYFKRSYSPDRIASLEIPDWRKKILPLGLNYFVFPSELDSRKIRRSIQMFDNTKNSQELLSALGVENSQGFVPRVDRLESLPNPKATPRILFMTRAWDPFDHPDRIKEKSEERVHINEMRASCIARLRQEFGNIFTGGFLGTDYALKNFKSFLVPNGLSGAKANYLELLDTHPICVATTGLHGSIGWKIAEYVALSKSIVSEKIEYVVPGGFRDGKNYLEFSTADECVARIHQLIEDNNLMLDLMSNNRKYYLSYLKPDKLVLRTLMHAIQSQSE